MRADRAWIAAILAWAAVQIGWRFAQGPALELDEAEALYHARELLLGYNAQPPLYFWLQRGVFWLLGEGILALAVLKNVLLAGGALALYAMLRRRRPPYEAGVAVMALGLLPQVLWEAQRALTHSVLALAVALCLMALADRLLNGSERPRRSLWLGFGLAMGLGAISKWNVVLLPAAILGAALIHPRWRARLDLQGLGIALGTALAVVAAPAWWVWQNARIAGGSLHKLEIADAGPDWPALAGLTGLASAWIAFCGLVLIFVGVLMLAQRRRGLWKLNSWRTDTQARLMAQVMLVAAVLLAVGIVAIGATEVKDRWLLPVAVFAGPLAALWALDRLGPLGRVRMARGLAGLWLLSLLLLPISGWISPGYRGVDFEPLARRIEAAQADGPIIVDDGWVAGNLVLRLPGREVRLVEDLASATASGPAILVTTADAPALEGPGVVPFGAARMQRGDRQIRLDLALLR